MKTVGWIATVVLAAFTGLMAWVAFTQPSGLAYMAAACFLAATLLAFPPLWRGLNSRSWLIARVSAVVALSAVAFLLPVKMTIKIDMPRPYHPSH
jgi:hypothetical protein